MLTTGSIPLILLALTGIAAEPAELAELPAKPLTEPSGTLRLELLEKAPGAEPVPTSANVFLVAPDGSPVKPPSADVPFFHDHFSADGTLSLELPPGAYRYEVERGPEHRPASGTVEVRDGETTVERATVERWIDLARRGWRSGELHVHRPIEHMGTLLRAADLHLAPVLTVWNRSSLWDSRPLPAELVVEAGPGRAYHILGCEDERRGGALLFYNLTRPLGFRGSTPEHPSPMQYLEKALEQPTAWVDVEKPFWWDAPTWVSSGRVHSIGIANNHMLRRGVLGNEAWGKPRDLERLPPPRGNGLYTQELYYRILDCGFRIPPSAGSASGVLPNPVGYNRVYVRMEDSYPSGPSWYGAWWKGLAEGRCFVTNGPILLVEANGRPPGEVFRGEEGRPFEVALDIRVDGDEPVERIEVVRDGEIVRRIVPDSPPGDRAAAGTSGGAGRGLWLRPEPLVFARPGWLLVRAIAAAPDTFRFASTGPWYVQMPRAERRVHRADVEYFIAWIDERMASLEASEDLRDPGRRESVLRPHREARKRFGALLAEAVAEGPPEEAIREGPAPPDGARREHP